ncbi:hypothetical protein [Hyphococcus lacteus]|uniref:Recombinase zinc beta ribbon domain-containing protein n=1 Tax=Hyphococcus lacteus TaxID=3143536 RepID=A0ABV3Z0B1_9PROT
MEANGQPKGVLATENYYFTCNGHCDCGTRLGSSYLGIETHSKAAEETIVGDLRKKGWSDAKIQRRLHDLKKTKAKIERTMESLSEHWGSELESWIELIQKLFSQKLTSHIGITVNDYSGLLNNPKFSLKRTELNRRSLTTEALESLAPATILIVK